MALARLVARKSSRLPARVLLIAPGTFEPGGFYENRLKSGGRYRLGEEAAGQTSRSVPEGLAPLYLEYEPGEYERAFTLSDAVDPAGISARAHGGVPHLRLPKAGPAKRQRIEVKADRAAPAPRPAPPRPARVRGGTAACRPRA